MRERPEQLLERIRSHLADGETVWAIYAGTQSLVATDRRVFLLAGDQVFTHDLGDFDACRREKETLVVLQRRGGGSIAIEVSPEDEPGLQALTVLGLLVTTRN